MRKYLLHIWLALSLLLVSVTPLYAKSDVPEPFCGDLEQEDCDLLFASSEAMFDLESYSTSVEYKLLQHGLPELPKESEAVLRIEGQYAFDDASRAATLELANLSREEPLQVVQAIADNPDLLLDLYSGMTSDLVLTLDLSQSWTHLLEDSNVEWPEQTTIEVRLVDGILYFDISQLKEFIPELADRQDWLQLDLVDAIQRAVDSGTMETLAAGVADSSEGRSVWGLDPTMLNLITTMRSAFGRPKNLWPYMEINRRRDVKLDGQKGALFKTDFNVLDFILSDDFHDVLMQSATVASQQADSEMSEEDITQMVDLFFLFAPSLFRDLEVSGTSTIGIDDLYQHNGKTLFHWDISTLVKALSGMGVETGIDLESEIFIDFSTQFENSAFNEPVEVEAPDDAEVIPLDQMNMPGLEEFN
ncbi:MAG: hypothetical protein U0175_38180 [Caldilineaceae bacterium]